MHPEFISQYSARKSILAKLLSVKKSEVEAVFRECKPLTKQIFSQLERYLYVGTMDRRKYEILYSLVRIREPRACLETGV